MKRFFALLTLLAFSLSLASPAMAMGENNKLSLEQALTRAKQIFNIPKDVNLVSQGMRDDDYRGLTVYEFNWNSEKINSYRFIRVEMDANTGDVLSFDDNEDWRPEKIKNLPKPITKEKARALAEAFMQKMQPGLLGQLKIVEQPQSSYPEPYNPSWGPKVYYFNYQRLVNGIPFPDNNINISVNGNTSKVTNYYFNWEKDLQFADVSKAIDRTKAEEIYRTKVGMGLRYVGSYGMFPSLNKKEVKLYYTTNNYQFYMPNFIDASSGNIIDNMGREVTVDNKVYVDLTKVPDQPPADNQKALTMDEALAKAKEYIKLSSDYTRVNSRYYEGWGNGNTKTWEFTFSKGEPWGSDPLNVSIDGITGELKGYNYYEPWNKTETNSNKITKEQAKEKAIAYLKQVAPKKYEQSILMDNPNENGYLMAKGEKMLNPVYTFTFQRTVYGIPYNDNNIMVGINNTTGEVVSYWYNWDYNVKLTYPADIITQEKALDSILANNNLQLNYMRKQSEDGRMSKEIILVYSFPFNQPNLVDAVTGKVMTQGDLEQPIKLLDTNNHWAQKEINILASAGIVNGDDGKYKPEDPITRAEFIKLLAQAKGLETANPEKPTFTDVKEKDWYYGYVEAAAKAGIIKGEGGKFLPNQNISRQEMAVMVMRSLKTGDADPAVLVFKDNSTIAPWAKDAVALAVEYGYITGQNGYFKPLNKTTRAEAAVFLFRVLEKSSGAAYGKGMAYAKRAG